MVKLKCKRCGREWDYSGDKKYYTTCPDFKTSVKIPEQQDIEEKLSDLFSQRNILFFTVIY